MGMTKPSTIPLFPLPLVVFPGEPRFLHIFEPRYQALLQDTLDKQAEGQFYAFGIVFQNSEGLVTVGTAVEVEQVLKTYPEGPSDILIRGHQRFKIDQVHQVELYKTADISWVEDTQPDWNEELATEAYQLHRTLTHLVLGEFASDTAYSGNNLLEVRSENERLLMLIEYLKNLLPELQRTEALKAGVRENWNIQKFTQMDPPLPTDPDDFL
jgi:Lon protease-like protein